MVVKTVNSVFGEFTSQAWRKASDEFQHDEKAFLFRLMIDVPNEGRYSGDAIRFNTTG